MNPIDKILSLLKRKKLIAAGQNEGCEGEENPPSKGILDSKYIDNLSGLFAENQRWKTISILLVFVLFVSIFVNLFESFYFMNKYKSVQYFAGWEVSPSGKSIEPGQIFPDRVSNTYIQNQFEAVAYKMSSWSYLNYEDSMKDLFQFYFSPNLITEQQVNIQQNGIVPEIRERKAVSIFTINREKSTYKWCEAIDAACGYVVGHEKITQGLSPWKENDIAYFMIANQKIPKQQNGFFTLTITRLIRCESVDQCEIYLDGAEKGKITQNSVSVSSR